MRFLIYKCMLYTVYWWLINGTGAKCTKSIDKKMKCKEKKMEKYDNIDRGRTMCLWVLMSHLLVTAFSSNTFQLTLQISLQPNLYPFLLFIFFITPTYSPTCSMFPLPFLTFFSDLHLFVTMDVLTALLFSLSFCVFYRFLFSPPFIIVISSKGQGSPFERR